MKRDETVKNKNRLFIILSIIIVLTFVIIVEEVIPNLKEKDCKNRVFNEMQTKSNDVIQGIVGIIPENTEKDLLSHNGIGSGVIFDKKDNTYYVVTARHVVNVDNSKFKIFTKNTEFSGQTINVDDDVNFEIPDDNYYQSILSYLIDQCKNDNKGILKSMELEEINTMDESICNIYEKTNSTRALFAFFISYCCIWFLVSAPVANQIFF